MFDWARCLVSCLFTVFVGRLRSFLLVLLVVFSLFLLAVLEAFCLFFVGRLGSFSLFSLAVLKDSDCRYCCFVVRGFLVDLASRSYCFLAFFFAILLAVLAACSSRSFLAKTFFWLSVSNWSAC